MLGRHVVQAKKRHFFRSTYREFTKMYRVVVLQPGYSIMEEDGSMRANGTSTLVVSSFNITMSWPKLWPKYMNQIGEELVVLVDTLSPWDKELLLSLLAGEGLTPENVTHLVRFCLSSVLCLSLGLSLSFAWICSTVTKFSSDVWRFAPMAIQTMWVTTTCSPQQRCKV